MGAAEGGVGIGQPLPVGQVARPGDPEGVEGRPAEGDSVGGAGRVKSQTAGHAGGHGVGALSGVVEPLRSHRRFVADATLYVVRHRQRCKEVLPTPAGVLAGGHHWAQIVAGMATLVLGEVEVVEVQVSDQGTVVERGAVRRGASAADERAMSVAAEILDLLPEYPDGLAGHGPDGTAQAV